MVLPKMIRYVKTFKVRDAHKDKSKKLMSFCIDDENLSKNIKPFGLRFKTRKKSIWMIYQFIMTDISKLKWKKLVKKFILNFVL